MVQTTARTSRATGSTMEVTDDTLGDYLRQIGRLPLLTAEEETELARQIEVGVLAAEAMEHTPADTTLYRELAQLVHEGEAAHARFVRSNLRLVVSVARRYVGRGMPFMDLIQEGNIGLDRAVQKFDFTQGYKFSTYAMWWIRRAITRCLYDSARLVRVPVHTEERISAMRAAARAFETDHGRHPTVAELSEETGFSEAHVRLYLDADRDPVSLHTPIGDDDAELGDLIEDGDSSQLVDIVAARRRHDTLYARIESLPPREAEIVKLHFGLTADAPMTFEQLGRRFGVSRERIRQLEQQALRRLRCAELGE
jgi:RNA polymerase sigma factor (sigma-70 family)